MVVDGHQRFRCSFGAKAELWPIERRSQPIQNRRLFFPSIRIHAALDSTRLFVVLSIYVSERRLSIRFIRRTMPCRYVNVLFLGSIFAVSVYNGASFYIGKDLFDTMRDSSFSLDDWQTCSRDDTSKAWNCYKTAIMPISITTASRNLLSYLVVFCFSPFNKFSALHNKLTVQREWLSGRAKQRVSLSFMNKRMA